MRKVKSFIRYFTALDLVDVEMTLEGNRIQGFRINYRAYIEEAWREVVRYDNSHRTPLHIHRFWPPSKGSKDFLETEIRTDYTDAVEEALSDLDTNWPTYRKKIERHLGEGGE